MKSIKTSFFLLLCTILVHGCFLLENTVFFGEPFYAHKLSFRNACNYNVEVYFPSGYFEDQIKRSSNAYHDSNGVPVLTLNHGEEIIAFAGGVKIDIDSSPEIWQNVLLDDRKVLIKANNNIITLDNKIIVDLLRNKNSYRGANAWIIDNDSLCP